MTKQSTNLNHDKGVGSIDECIYRTDQYYSGIIRAQQTHGVGLDILYNQPSVILLTYRPMLMDIINSLPSLNPIVKNEIYNILTDMACDRKLDVYCRLKRLYDLFVVYFDIHKFDTWVYEHYQYNETNHKFVKSDIHLLVLQEIITDIMAIANMYLNWLIFKDGINIDDIKFRTHTLELHKLDGHHPFKKFQFGEY